CKAEDGIRCDLVTGVQTCALPILGSVLGGYALSGGHLAALLQPTELLTIAGAAGGAFFVANSPKVVKATIAAIPKVFKGTGINRSEERREGKGSWKARSRHV